jgi:hypothetical protein
VVARLLERAVFCGSFRRAGAVAVVASASAQVVALAFALGCSSGPNAPATSSGSSAVPPPPTAAGATDDPVVGRGILRRAGETIIDGSGQPVRLRGVAFGNQVWGGRALPITHHGEVDYGRVRAMGMNAIRFYMYYGTFEDDRAPFAYKAAGWQWLDTNIAWARRHGVYLILNMHVPPGGFQSNGEGRALWETPANQDRLVALWRAIATHTAKEPMIAGYDLLNEPGVTKSKASGRRWPRASPPPSARSTRSTS